ncbi:GNAT family N-acetyltransferase [Oligosphaera ethanolica]|jgi:ribosomal protein S18 acetylase RimI-like enzyme|uniref:Ribosomal protein S18 acetylase RimI-like enzyme n=1 Tax=Oligosphaera ethanolica TaxID=760260 RepID=A0AAE4AQQ9_9BACT|nr:GNAT family N-acetyltransferase [Oligosphaera ethanolica]MDQ0291790.1 ribosomal protein S18 acetylase RimI-like enzyme [Oligosphaera ethanolica]NLE53468.1 GNAT family N-acetyltransferase [Lentisphaerota bacterium]HQL09975.1 GNAT family N-acetyltransferase [Lentisphaeria bacterium]
MSDIVIRPTHETDAPSIHAILVDTAMFTDAEVEVADELIDIFLHKAGQKDYIMHSAVDQDSGAPVGYVCFGPTPATESTWDLYWIAVDPKQQGRGIGRQLLRFAEEQCRNMGAKLIIIETSSQPKYQPTQHFYTGNGYIVEARIKDFYAAGDDRLIYTRRF